MALRRAATAPKPVRAFSAVADAADAPADTKRNVGKPLGTYQWDDPFAMKSMLNEGTFARSPLKGRSWGGEAKGEGRG